MPHVAFIGLGRMGHGMAGRYLNASFTVAVWNRSTAKADELIAHGARAAERAIDSIQEAIHILALQASVPSAAVEKAE